MQTFHLQLSHASLLNLQQMQMFKTSYLFQLHMFFKHTKEEMLKSRKGKNVSKELHQIQLATNWAFLKAMALIQVKCDELITSLGIIGPLHQINIIILNWRKIPHTRTKGVLIRQAISLDFDWIH
jgi:hypothetical protein